MTISCISVPRLSGILLLGLATLLSFQTHATEGAFVHAQGAIGRSLTGAGVAYPIDATWMMLNPASIVHLDRRLDLGLDIVRSDVTLAPGGVLGNPFSGEMTDHRYFFIPSAGLILPTANGAVGLGFYVPSGIGDDFDESRNLLTRLLPLNADRRLDYQQLRLALTYGHKLGSGWSVGAGLYANLSRFRTDSLTLSLRTAAANHDWDEAPGLGFVLGVHKQWDRWSFGASYTSPQWSEPFDKYKDVSTHSVVMPQIVQVGVAYKLKPFLTLMADYRYINWSGVKPLGLKPLEGGFGWQDQHIYKLAAEWRMNDLWTLRSGFSTGNPAASRENVFINGLTSASAVTSHFGLGLSRAIGKNSELHVTYLKALNNRITASRSGDLFSFLSAGTQIGLGHDEITIGYTHKF